MTDAVVLEIIQRALSLGLMVCLPILGVALIVGLSVSVFQAATSINEMTLTFVPKLVAMAVVIVVLGPWILHQLLSFTGDLISSIPTLVK
jgi:flagellar biosynthetic protein FliQ